MKSRLEISGMHCKSCETLITEAFMEIPGMVSVKVDNKKGTAEIEHNGASIDEIKKSLKEMGYKLRKVV